jgi:hypothetical protein
MATPSASGRGTRESRREHSIGRSISSTFIPIRLGYLILAILALHALSASATVRQPPLRSLSSVSTSNGGIHVDTPQQPEQGIQGRHAGYPSPGTPSTADIPFADAHAQPVPQVPLLPGPRTRSRRGTADGHPAQPNSGQGQSGHAHEAGAGAGTTPAQTTHTHTHTSPKPKILSDLRRRSIYQVLTDRFGLDLGLNADGTEKMVRCDPDERRYCGGTWKGIERRLGYIQGMGFDTGRFLSRCGHG